MTIHRGPPHGATFAQLLRRYRLDANLTQEALAVRAGLTVQAVGMLERGKRRLPRRSTVVLLSQALRLDPTRARALQQASEHASPHAPAGDARNGQARSRPPEPRSGIPPDPIPHFVSREAELAELERLLRRNRHVAVHGLGGVGKTQLVIRHLHRNEADYPNGCFWLRADQERTLVGDLASLAWRLDLPERDEPDQERQIEAVLRWLREHQRWLLVLDNLEPATEDVARHWLSPGLGGRLLVTSRTPMWSARLGLEPLSLDVSRRFLLERAGQSDEESAGAVAETLGCLPLALEQAAAYLQASGRDLASYADLLRTRLVELMREGTPKDYRQPVATTWHLSFERVKVEHPAAADLLRLCAFLAADDIPVSLLMAGAGELSARLREALGDEVECDRAIAALRRYSLLERQGDRLRVHRLVQAVVRESLEPGQREVWLAAVICLLRAAFPVDPSPSCVRLVPHVQAAERLAGDRTIEWPARCALLDRAGTCLWASGDYQAARDAYERVLALRERMLGTDHLDTAATLNTLGNLLKDQGEVDAARRSVERGLGIRERVLGPASPEIAESLNSLGIVLMEQGELAAARPVLERALAVREQVLTPDHPRVADCLNNLGVLLRMQGDPDAARPLVERALSIRERVLGPDHPRTANSLHSLATLLRMEGELAQARLVQERALAIREQTLGPDHAVTADSVHQLAILLMELGDLPAARSLAERALSTWLGTLGAEHWRTMECASTLRQIMTHR